MKCSSLLDSDLAPPLDFDLISKSIPSEVTTTATMPETKPETIDSDALEGPSFSTVLRSESLRVRLSKSSQRPRPSSQIRVQAKDFSEGTNAAVLELLRAMLLTPENYLNTKDSKGPFNFGFKIRNGYSILVSYKSASQEKSRFVLSRISLSSPNGTVSEIGKDFLSPNGKFLDQETFTLDPKKFPASFDLSLDVPLVIEGEILRKLERMSSYFVAFRKDQKAKLRSILKSNSLFYIATRFRLQVAKNAFNQAIFRLPAKQALSLAILGGTSALGLQYFQGPEGLSPLSISSNVRIEEADLAINRINGILVPENQPVVQGLLAELKQLLLTQSNKSNLASENTPRPLDLNLQAQSEFSRDHLVWIYQKKASTSGEASQTYIVFAKEMITDSQNSQISYTLVEIDPIKYAPLIDFINQKTLLTP